MIENAKVRTVPINGETPATIRGRLAHQEYNPGDEYDLKVVLPSGLKPDAVGWNTQVVRELKPNNRRAIKRGETQVERYRQELKAMTGTPWASAVDTYE